MKFFIGAFSAFLLLSCATKLQTNNVMLADVDPITVGEVEMQLDKAFSSKLDTTTAEVVFNPRDNTVFLEFKYQFVTYRQFWNEPDRSRFITAVDQYHKDFDAQNLIDRISRTQHIYGTVSAKTEWQSLKFAQWFRSFPTIELGYGFNQKNPYLILLQRSAADVSRAASDTKTDSLQITMYFTRNQAKELADFFDQSFLLAHLGNQPQRATPQVDQYGTQPEPAP
ncbi:hypothetical protein FACS1894172_13680 [Spirochaetia bacterium]|nr:hypothetical protein FACS1894164_15600 [Spirochaetia bacterium]GHU34008.1 hypothetical protein FACS1894172_13680 [Spirochaetia bacterium]